MTLRMGRATAISAGAAAAAALAVLAVLHAPPVRTRVLTWAIGQLDTRYGLVLAADGFGYNLVTGSATLTNVRLAARGSESQPFFAAALVRADVPLAAYAGSLILDEVEVVSGRVDLLTSAAGRSNLPGQEPAARRGTSADDDRPRSIAIHGLRLRDFAFTYDNRTTPLHVAAAGIDASLDRRVVRVFDGITGPLSVSGGVDVRWRDRALAVAPFDTRVAFDGQDVSLQDLPVVTSMGRVLVSGRIDRVLDDMALELTFDGDVDVAQAATWAPPPVPVAGTARVQGSITGPRRAPEVVVRVDAPSLTVGRERDLTASGEVVIDTTRVLGNRVTASPASGGQVDGTFDLGFGGAPLTASASWQGVDARVFQRAADLEDQPVGMTLDGQARYASGPRRQLALVTDLRQLRERGVTPIDGRIEATLDGSRWTLTPALRTSGVTLSGQAAGQLDPDDAARSSLSGPMRVTVSRLADADRSLAPHGIRIPSLIRDSSGAIGADVTLAGTLGSPSATIVAIAPDLDLPLLGNSSVEATVHATRTEVVVSPLSIAHGSMLATGEVTVDVGRRALAGTIHAAVADARDVQGEVPERWRAAGALAADAALGGTLDSPHVDVTVASPALEIAGETFANLDARVRVTGAGLEVSALTLEKDEGVMRASGQYGFDRSFQAVLDVTNTAWTGRLVGDVESRAVVNGRFEGNGSLDQPTGRGRFGFAVAGGVAGDLVGEGTLDVALIGDQARVNLILPSLGAYASGSVSIAAPHDYRGVAVLNRLDLGQIAPLVGAVPGQVDGFLSLSASASGVAGSDEPPTVLVNLQQVEAQIAGIPLSLAAPAAVTWQQGELALKEMAASFGTGRITAYGEWAGREHTILSGTFDGELAEVVQAARAFGLETGVVARGNAAAYFHATANRGDIIASLDLADGYVEAADGLVLTGLSVSAGVTGESVTLHAASGHVDMAKASGDFRATGRATIPDMDVRRATGRLVLDEAGFDSAGMAVTQTRPSTFSLKDGVVSMDDVVWEAAGSRLAVGGKVDVSGGSPALTIDVTGVAVLRVLSAFVPTLGIDGTADVDVHVGGTLDSPDLSGGIELNRAEIALASPRLVVSDLSGPITLNGNRVELRGLTGSANGGTLVVDGGVVLKGLAIANGEIYVQAAGMAVEYPRGLRSEIDALLTYRIGVAPSLAGDVRVQRSAYTAAVSLAALAGSGGAPALGPGPGRSVLDALRLNVNVTTVDDLRVDNNYGRFEGGAQLRIVGTVGEPGMTGRVTLREGGTVYAAGRTFTLERGTISFTNLNRLEPDLDIQAQTRLAGQGDVTMTVQGTPERLSFDLTSENQGSQEEIATAMLGGNVSSANALALLSSDFLGVTGQQLGLDQLRIDRGDVVRDEFREDPSALSQDEADPVTRLTLSKRIRDDVEFTVSQNLRANGKATFVVSYYPIPALELRAISRDNADFGVGLRHQVTFGAGAGVASAPTRPTLRVAAVRFEGDLSPLGEAQLRGELRVRATDVFDYYAWQRDLDALTAQFIAHGYYEARVRGRRDDRGNGVIDVVYAVDRGPATRIEVEGTSLPDRELRAIRQTWNRAVFDRFVIEDAVARVERHLLASGFIAGSVRGSVAEAGGVKTLRLQVSPGVSARRRTIRFQGNDGIPDSRLDAVVAQSGLEVEGWIDHSLLVEALSSAYRNQGYLSARIAVADPVLEGSIGVLPVTMQEGARASIDELHWPGVSDERMEDVQAASRLSVGTPYSLDEMTDARERVERRYRTDGYNSVMVTTAVVPNESDTGVAITFTVTEGLQQVLAEVVTSGTTRTRPGVVSRALRLPDGEPVNLEEWALARKRLFDTNVFRSVDIQAVPVGEAVDGRQPVQARVTVEEYPPWRLRYGLQVDRERDVGSDDGRIDNSLGAIAELRNQNILGRAITGGAALRVERDFQRANTFLQTASFFTLPVRSGAFLYASRENTRFDGDLIAVTDVQGLSVEQRWRRRLGFEITYGYRFETNRTYDPDPIAGDEFPLDVTANVARLNAAMLFDRRNNPVDATRGTFASVSFERAARWLGADDSFDRVLAQQHLFVPVGPLVLASRAIGGRGFGPDDLRFSDRFFAGGASTVRGYAENSLGSRDLFGLPRGGSQMLIVNQEVRFPVYRWVGALAFVDVGNVFDDVSSFAWGQMKVGYGAGLRINSPVGLLRVDFGIPGSGIATSTRRPNRLGSGRWYFGIGHIF